MVQAEFGVVSAKRKPYDVIESSELQAGDVFGVIDQPGDIVGEVFYKHPRLKRIKRVMEGDSGDYFFSAIVDIATLVYFQSEFKRSKVVWITNFKPSDHHDQLKLPW